MKTPMSAKFLQFLLLTLFVFVLNVGWGQVNISAGTTITQNFNSALGTSAIATWTNNSTVAGWYITTATLPLQTGSVNGNSVYNCGISGTNALSDRALGALSTSTTHRFGLRLLNNGSSSITSFSISFTGEQWRSFNAGTLVFEYQTGSTVTSLTSGTWTAATAFDFASLQTSTGAALDGNASANRTNITGILSVTVAANTEIFFRWTKAGSSSPCLAIDDLSITGINAPTLSTPTATSIAITSATLGATVTSNGGATLTARGTVWGTAAAPAGNSLAEGSTTVSAFSHSRTSLTANTLYYYRGYATNSVGTSYSADGTFTTLPLAPTVGAGSSASTSGFTANWTAPTMGSVAYTYTVEVDDDNAFGSINSTTPSISSSSTSQTITGLSASTTYYYRVKAVNAQGSSVWSTTSAGIATSAASSPTLTAVTLGSALSSAYGTASTGVSFTVGGSNLSATITATPQSGYEISSSLDGTYQSTEIVGIANGSTLYVRFASTKAAGSYNGATAVVLSSTGASDANIYTSATSNSVTQKALSVDGLTAQNKVYDGLTTATVTGTAALVTSGIVNSDVVSLSGLGTFTFSSSAVGAGIEITTTGYLLTGTNAGNYSLTQPSFSGDITVRNLTITASNVSKFAGVALTGGAGSTAFTSSGLQNSEIIGTVTISYGTAGDATGDGNTVGEYASQVTPSAATGGTFTTSNYSISYVAGSITVTAAPVTLTAWDFNGYLGGGSSPQSPTTSNSNLTIGGLTRGSGLGVSSAAANTWGQNVPQTSPTNEATAITANSFITFTIKSNAGSSVSIMGVGPHNIRRSGTGYTTGQWQYSVNGTTYFNIGTSITWSGTTSAGNSQAAIDLSSISNLQNITSSTTVTFRLVLWGATGSAGSWYLNEFQTGNDFNINGIVKTAPVLSTPTSASITTTSATLGATISSDGGASVEARGTVWGTAAAPTGNSLAESGTTVEAFSHSRTGLTANTLYYYRGYATNSVGTGYSADGTFTTLPLAPTVGSGSSASASGFTASWTAAAMGSATFTYTVEVDDDNAFGSVNATVSPIASSNTSAAITGLAAGTTYYYRVKAVNTTGSSSWSSTSVGYATLSTDATLSALSLSSGTLNPVFASATIAYTASVTNATTSITVTPTRNQANATIQVRVNGGSYSAVTSGNASGSLSLNEGLDNTVDVRVTAQDGSTIKTYTITVTRAATTPSAPTITSITPGNQQLSVAFTAGATGGSAITNYKYSTDGGTTFTTVSPAQTTSPIVITGLTNGTAYNVQILAVNAVGDGTPSGSTSSTPVTTPGAPTITSITPGNGQLSVAFTAGTTGGSAITNYKYSTDGGSSFVAVSPAATSSPITITGLVNGTSYNVQIKAVNAVGDGAATGSTAATPVTTPGAPSIGTAVLGDGQATVTFSAPASNGGTAITSYTVTSSPGSITATGSESPITITGLTNGTAYTFTVIATNVVGTGPESAASNEVTPSTIAVPAINSSLTASATYGVVATTYTITATNSPTSFSATDLPSGLILNTSTGNITGTPTAAPGDYNVTITATNAGGTGLPATLVYSISAKTLTLSDASASSKVYNGTNAAVVTGTLTGVVGSDDVSLVGTGTFSQIGIGTGLTVTSTATLTGAKASYYTLTQPTGLTANITAKPITVTGATASNRAYTGLASANITDAALVGVIAPDVVTVSGGGTFASVNVANTISVTAALSLSGADAGNYTLTQPTGLTANITPAILTITGLTGADKVYDGLTTATASGIPAYSGLVNGESFALLGTAVLNFTSASVGNLKTITVAGFEAPSVNYSVSQPSLTANITAAVLTITGLTGVNKNYDGTTSATVTGTASYAGLQNGETAAVSGTPTFNFSDANVGTGKTITVAGYTAPSNYTVIQPTGLTGNITIANQTITALTTPITKILSDLSYSVATTATSGLTVTYASDNSSVATVAANGTVTIQGIGTATITASQTGNGNYNPATNVTQALTVNPNPVITATPDALAAFTSSTGSASAAQAFTVSGSNLISNVTVTPPLGFEVSLTSGSGYSTSSLTINQSSGTANATVYVRLTSIASAGIYSGDVAMTSTSATTSNVSVSGTVSLAVTSGLIAGWDFQTTSNGGTAAAAAPNTPTNFTANFGSGNIYLNGTNGSSTWVTATSGNQLASFGGTTNVNVGSGFSTSNSGASSLSLIPGTSLAANGKSLVFKFSMTGYKDLIVSYAVNVSATTSFSTHQWDYSTNGTSWTTGQTITTFTTTYGTKTLTTITNLDNAATGYLRLTVSGATNASSNTRIDNVQLNASANPSPAIIAGGGPLSSLNTTFGTASSPTSFTVSGSNLSSTISIAALSGFEFNNPSANSNYTSTLSGISSTGPTTINVRLSNAASVGTYSGNIVCTSGSTTLNVPMSASAVSKATPTLSISNSPQTYSGSSITASVTGSVAGTVSNVKYNGSATVPSAAGTYAITADFVPTDGNNYNSIAAASAGDFVISTASLTITASNQSKCQGAPLTLGTLQFTTSGLVGSDAVSSVTLTSSGSDAAAAAGSYSIVPSAASGSGLSNYNITYANGSLTVNTLPTVTSTANQTVCAGTSVTLSGSGASSYSWNNSISNGVAFTPTSTTTYTVTGTDSNGCTATATSTVTVNALPAVVTLSAPAYCSNTTGTISASASQTNVTYDLWIPGEAVPNTNTVGTGSALTWSGLNAGDYFVVATNANNCTASSETITLASFNQYSYYPDTDGDGFGAGAVLLSCSATTPANYSTLSTDCNDNNASISPGAAEVCGDGIDNNCDNNESYPSQYRSAVATGDWSDASTWEKYCNDGGAWSAAQIAPYNQYFNVSNPFAVTIQSGHTVTVSTTSTTAFAKAGSLSVAGNLIVNGNLTVTSSVINSGNVTINHGASFVQSSENTTNTGSGNFIVNMNLTGTNNGTAPNGRYWYLGSPMNNTVASLFFDQPKMVRLWSYNLSNNSWVTVINSSTTASGATNSTLLATGMGYLYRAGVDKTIIFTGDATNLNNNITTPLSFTGTGYKYVSNPYTSHVDWRLVTRTGLNVSYWIRNAANNAYEAYNATSGVSTPSGTQTTRFIPPMQGFWIYAFTASSSLRMDNGDRTHSTNVLHAPMHNQVVRLNLNDGKTTDQAVVYENENASNGIEEYDTDKFMDENHHQVYFLEGTKQLTLDGLKDATAKQKVDMGIQITSAGTYTINAVELGVEEDVMLEDKFTHTFQDLKRNSTYSFTSNAGNYNNRFVLHFTLTPAAETAMETVEVGETEEESEGVNIYTTTGQTVKVWITNTTDFQNATVKVYDAIGNLIERKNMTSNELLLDLDTATGVYLVEVTGAEKTFTKKVFISK